ncbi:MAG: DUF3494 domain-containing protein [Flavobacteriaceae bacterium]|nr:DUF3494 domain-containing protein [Flavobacteriaceae bacterium]
MIKRRRFLLFTFLLVPFFGGAQVGIGTVDPDPSALLDLTSNKTGLLVPRMTTQERHAISNPATGLLVYNTSTSEFNFFDGDWTNHFALARNYNSNLTGDITTTATSSIEVVNGMSISPPFDGKYKVTFNSYYSNAPISIGPFTSLEAKTDLQATYNYLIGLPNPQLAPVVLGNGNVLVSGVYSIPAAASTMGTLYFDGEKNPDALFVIRIAGAFSVGASAKMVLLNGAKVSNIFWVVEGATSIEASSIVKGTVITNAGAITMKAGGNLEGRLFALTGAVEFNSGTARLPSGNSVINLGVLSTFVFFSGTGAVTNAGSSLIKGNVGSNEGDVSGYGSPTTFKGSILYPGGTITTSSPNYLNALGTFGIYQNGDLILSSNKSLTSNANSTNLSLQAIATISAGQAIDIRWDTDSEKIMMGNRTLNLIKVQ